MNAREQQFYDSVREIIIFLFIYTFLYAVAYLAIRVIRRSNEHEDFINYEDAIANTISISLCTFTLATCIGAVLLLPISIIANEVILIYPNSFYWKWLNSSLIHGLWNKTFLFSNLSLFLFIPFAYFLTEAIGLPGCKKGIRSRMIETGLLVLVITLGILGITYVISSIIDSHNAQVHSFFNIRDYHLPFLYSCISFIGVLFLLICAPLGFQNLFTTVSALILKIAHSNDLAEQLYQTKMEQTYLKRKIDLIEKVSPESDKEVEEFDQKIKKLEKQIRRSELSRNLVYPLIMLLLLVLTSSSILIVARNTIYVIFGFSSIKQTDSQSFNIGIKSLYTFGFVQTIFEIILIFYFIIASLVGLYSLPLFKNIKPTYQNTPMRIIILNCLLFIMFSSALPISSKILGLTNFDLLGRFGDFDWLGNLNLILTYNLSFGVAMALCLINKLTSRARQELLKRLSMLLHSSMNKSVVFNRPHL